MDSFERSVHRPAREDQSRDAGSHVLPELLVSRTARDSLFEFLAFLRLPNDSVIAEDIQRNADWVEDAFRRRGFLTRQLPNQGRPLVFAEYGQRDPRRGTILFYFHFDGQPVIAEEWSQESPWIPVLKERVSDGGFRPVSVERLNAAEIDPELRVFARSAADDKGPIMSFLSAFDVLREARLEPAINVRVLLDSEEERSSPNLLDVVTAHHGLVEADGLVVHDGPMHISGNPTLIFGNRGLATVTLTVFGPRRDLHSGKFGNYVPNPVQRLASLLASMKDDDGRVTIPGYYEGVKLSIEDKEILKAIGDDEAALIGRLGIARSECVGETYQEALQYPALNIRGIAAGGVGEKSSAIIPRQAVAELDLRSTPEVESAHLLGLIEDHIRNRGYHIVRGEPTEEERAAHDKLISIELKASMNAARMSMSSPIGIWAFHGLQSSCHAPGMRPVRLRMMGGTAPTGVIVGKLSLPFVIVPLVNPDNSQHSHDENLRIGNYVAGIRTVLGLLQTPYP